MPPALIEIDQTAQMRRIVKVHGETALPRPENRIEPAVHIQPQSAVALLRKPLRRGQTFAQFSGQKCRHGTPHMGLRSRMKQIIAPSSKALTTYRFQTLTNARIAVKRQVSHAKSFLLPGPRTTTASGPPPRDATPIRPHRLCALAQAGCAISRVSSHDRTA